MTSSQLQILQHALGVDKYGQGEQYRNHFCAGGTDEGECRALVAMGYMRTWQAEGYPYYNCSVTDEGKEAMKRESPFAPVLTRGQKRYRQFLQADTGLSFGEWLRGYANAK